MPPHRQKHGYADRVPIGDDDLYGPGDGNNDDFNHHHGLGVFVDDPGLEEDYIHGEMVPGEMNHPDHGSSDHQRSWVHLVREDLGNGLHAQRSEYQGEFRQGICHGHGKMTWYDGGWYVGEWRDGTMHGHGKEIRPNGTLRHEGEWCLGYPIYASTGIDSMVSASLSFPTGNTIPVDHIWDDEHHVDDPADTILVTDKDIVDCSGEKGIYTGALSKFSGMPNGKGRLEYQTMKGRWYEGDWIHGRWTGHGRLSNEFGDSYEGGVKNYHKHGTGVTRFADGRVFEGEYNLGQMTQGKMTYQDGSVYDGSWVNGMQQGQGKCMFVDGSQYEGEFRGGNFHGHGQMTWNDGGWYVGEWSDGEMRGRGKEIRGDGSVRHDGEWFRGLPVRQESTSADYIANDDDETFLVTKQKIVDPNGITVIYTGDLSKATGKPHGKGRMEYKVIQKEHGDEWFRIRVHLIEPPRSTESPFQPPLFLSQAERELRNEQNQELDKDTYADDSDDQLFVTLQPIVDPYGEKGVYTGTLSKSSGMPHGKGYLEYETKEGRWYDGDWIHGHWNGHGEVSNGDGGSYEGSLQYDYRHGAGVMRFGDGRVFEGEFSRDEMIEGKMTNPDGTVHHGLWVNGMLDGQGKCIFVDGTAYEGEFRKGKFHGRGQMTWNDGGFYVGEWSYGAMHGNGKEFLPGGGLGYEGEWFRGQPIHESTCT